MTTNTTPSFPPARKDPRQVVNTLKRVLNYNDSDAALAGFANGLPSGAFIVSVQVYVVTAFNAGTTNPITVGTNATSYNNIAQSGDITNASATMSSPTRGLGTAVTASGDVAVYATYVPTGTAPTAGQAVIVITYEGGNLS